MLTLICTALQTQKSMKIYFFCHFRNIEDSLMKASAPTIDESRCKGKWAIVLYFQWCLTFCRTFQAKDSVRNAFAITAVTKSSWHIATAKEGTVKKYAALAISELCLSEGISQSVSQSVNQSDSQLKILLNKVFF